MIRPAAFVTCLALLASADAGEFNKTLDIGDPAPEWIGLSGTDGKSHALADLKDKAVVVVVFTCNSCPVAVAYEGRIKELLKEHGGPDGKVAVVAINVNTGRADALPAMTERAEKEKFPFAYLYDPTQQIARDYGATFTPEFFVLDRERKVAYMGAMDDRSPPGEPKANYLRDAIDAVLAGEKPAKAESSAAAGCRIKFTTRRADD